MRRLTLTEYQVASNVPLTIEERDALKEVAKSITISPTPGREGYYDLTPGAEVGGIALRTLAIEIYPKIPIDRLLFLISYVLHRRRWQEFAFQTEDSSTLVEAIAYAFVSQIRRALQRGVLQGYRVEEDALLTVRGRVRIEDQIRSRFGIPVPVEVRYDEFTEDIEENRLLRAAISRVLRLPLRSSNIRKSLHAYDGVLRSTCLIEYDPRRLPTINYTRLNERYRPAVELAKLILRSRSFELQHGHLEASSFLVNMNQVFEDFVILALRDELNVSEYAFAQAARCHRLHLDEAARIELEPDISWWEGRRCTFVGDVKYKRIGAEGIVHPDLYQLLAYTIATDLPSGMLIYAAGEEIPITHTVIFAGKRLEVVTLDLEGSPQIILEQIRGLAESIRLHRYEAMKSALVRNVISSSKGT